MSDYTLPRRADCYIDEPGQCEGEGEHPDWRHPETWEEVKGYLEMGWGVTDRDGDRVKEVKQVHDEHGWGEVILLETGTQYRYEVWSLLVDANVNLVPPATPEEEADALASILKSVSDRRLTHDN